MQTVYNPAPESWEGLLARPSMSFAAIEEKVRPIMQAVREHGDQAVRHYSELFDGVRIPSLEVSASELEEAAQQISAELKSAIALAHANISKFHAAQKEDVQKIETMPGVQCWRKSIGIEKVGLYIPGGSAPLFSTVLMLAVPAKLAGCREIVLCTPPNKQGKVHPAILYAAMVSGVTRIFKAGGAQAIAAMTFGTESVPKVYKLFGPGNQYVTAAKQLATQHGLAIDMPAGPSEVMVLADGTAHPDFVAADLLSQAEHGSDSQVVLVSTDKPMIELVAQAVERQLDTLPRKEIAKEALSHSICIWVPEEVQAMALCNLYAPEHLILAMGDAARIAEQVVNAGSVFIGHYTPESVGDYASGTNHTLPTYGFARNFSGASLDSFVRKVTFQKLSEEGLKALGPAVCHMAEAEQLQAHSNAVSIRLQKLQ